MIITKIIGGLGNQMFQYAVGRSLSIKHDVPLRLDVSSFDNYTLHQGFELARLFNCSSEIQSGAELRNVLGLQSYGIIRSLVSRKSLAIFRYKEYIIEPHFQYWKGVNNVSENAYLAGYWQSEKYFLSVAEQIRTDFSFKLPMSKRNAEVARKIAQVNSVGLHVRRGDYVSNLKNSATHGLCTLQYYKDALAHIVKHVKDPNFFIFSDDIDWVKNNLGMSLACDYIEHNFGLESYNDMRLMSLCQHNIIANSSFSWWGAWLNANSNKIVVAPKQWFSDGPNSIDLLPPGWVKL